MPFWNLHKKFHLPRANVHWDLTLQSLVILRGWEPLTDCVMTAHNSKFVYRSLCLGMCAHGAMNSNNNQTRVNPRTQWFHQYFVSSQRLLFVLPAYHIPPLFQGICNRPKYELDSLLTLVALVMIRSEIVVIFKSLTFLTLHNTSFGFSSEIIKFCEMDP